MLAVNALLLATLAAQDPRADTMPPAAAVELPYVIHSGALGLGGTLTLPHGATERLTVAVIIAGSGPTDRNGNSAMAGIRPNTYAQLAWRLAERGIATLRYDKRALPATTGTFDLRVTPIDAYAADARAAAESLAVDPRFARVVFVGHSEGALLAPLAARAGAPVAGVASISGMGRPMGVVLREQLARQLDTATLRRYDAAMAVYLRGETPSDVPAAVAPLLAPLNQTFMRSVMTLDPAEVLRGVRQPVLILQGALDAQITVADAERLHGARRDARLVVLPQVNHVLKHATTLALGAQMPSYQDPGAPIVGEVVDVLVEWIKQLAQR